MILRVTLLAGCILVAGCSGQRNEQSASTPATKAPPASSPNMTVVPLAVPATAGASEPQLTSSSRGTILSWIESNGTAATLKFAERTGTNWSDPRTVATGKDWFLSDADMPTVQRLVNGTLVDA